MCTKDTHQRSQRLLLLASFSSSRHRLHAGGEESWLGGFAPPSLLPPPYLACLPGGLALLGEVAVVVLVVAALAQRAYTGRAKGKGEVLATQLAKEDLRGRRGVTAEGAKD